MEATLLPIFGAALPERWRDAVSFRRLLVVFRHADPDSPMHLVLRGRPAWRVEHELLDMVRRTTESAATRKASAPSHLSPHAQRKTSDTHKAALADARKRAEDRRKETG